MRKLLPLLALCLLAVAPAARAEAPRGYYRFPALAKDAVLFTAEGDLWAVPLSGGLARRLTSHPGAETQAAVSPDGRTVAFSAAYEGPVEVFTMPLEGGLPTRRTFDGQNATVVGWTPDGRILYATRRFATLPATQLVALDPRDGRVERIPLAQAADGCYSDDGQTFYFTRLPRQGSFTKRYQGGQVQTLWKWTGGKAEATPLTADYKGCSKEPMWWQGRVYFLSDRDGTMNLWSMNPTGGDLKQLTKLTGLDAAAPCLADGRIVYQQGADLRLYDIARGADSALDIRLSSDLDQEREKWITSPLDYVTAAHLSPDGDRVALTARGQVFVMPVEKTGRRVEATRKPMVRYRQARFLPDGKALLALSDESGEVEFWKLPANGVGAAERLTNDGHVLRWDGLPSPDGKRIAHYDKDQVLWVYDIAAGRDTKVATCTDGDFAGLTWAPDSRWLAWQAPATNLAGVVSIFSVESGVVTPVTSDRFESYAPAWSADGKWLFFLSERNFESLTGSPWGPRAPEPFFDKPTKIYAVGLVKGTRWPFQPDDELMADKGDDAAKAADAGGKAKGGSDKAGDKAGDKDKEKGKKEVTVTVETAGLMERLYEVPVKAGNYEALTANGKLLFWLSRATDETGDKRTLQATGIDNKGDDPSTVLAGVSDYELSGDGKKMLVKKGKDYYVFDAAAKGPGDLGDAQLPLDGWSFSLSPREEWRQMYTEAWRLERDYFYDRNMNGVSWPAIRDKYLPLVDRVTDRDELADILGQMISELSALHMYVYGGDFRKGPDNVQPAQLGARLVRDTAAGGFRVEHIYRSDPDFPADESPLLAPGVEVAEGDVITQINGQPTAGVTDVGALLRNQAGKPVLAEVKPAGGGAARRVILRPFGPGADTELRYDEWEYTRRRHVEEAGQGRLGYVHLRAMGTPNIAEFTRDYFPVFNRDGLIVDVRNNRGGNIDSWVMSRLLKKAWAFWQPRVGNPYWNMQYAFRGPMIVLVNEYTASDGELFAEGFRRLGLGKVVGNRSWGGEIWLSSSNFLVDRGIATAAENGTYGLDAEWLVEGHGVDPDIVVDNLPRATFDGQDAQLDAAIKELLETLKKNPVPPPTTPKYPDKSFKH